MSTLYYYFGIASLYRNDSTDTVIFRFNTTVRIANPWYRNVLYDSYRESYDAEITGQYVEALDSQVPFENGEACIST
jgi:hypothetical protein